MGATVFKISRFALPTLGAALGAGAYVLAGGSASGTAFLLIMHCGILLGWVAHRTLHSAALALGHAPLPYRALDDAAADAIIDRELGRLEEEDAGGEGDEG